MKETITDYETREVERTVAVCDLHNCGVTDDESEMLELSVENEGGTRETRHYCVEHAQAILGIDSDIERIVDGADIVVEENALIKFPRGENCSGNSHDDFVMMVLFCPVVFAIGAASVDTYGQQDGFWDGAAAASWGLLFYGAIAIAILLVVL